MFILLIERIEELNLNKSNQTANLWLRNTFHTCGSIPLSVQRILKSRQRLQRPVPEPCEVKHRSAALPATVP